MKTGKLQKVLSLLLAAVLTLAMSVTAFAAPEGKTITPTQKGSITVNNLETGVVVEAYKIISLNVNNDGAVLSPMYSWNEEVAKWLRSYNDGQYAFYIDEEGYVTEQFVEDKKDTKKYKSFFHDLAAALKTTEQDKKIDLQPAKEARASAPEGEPENVTATLSDLEMGEYLLIAKNGTKIYLPTAEKLVPEWDDTEGWKLKNGTVSMKGEPPTIEKTVDEAQVAVGDTVNYTITVTVPSYPEDAFSTAFYVGDKLSEGLTLKPSSIAVTTENGTIVTSGTDYTLTTTNAVRPDDNQQSLSFLLDFKEAFTTAHAGEKLKITYSAVINENAVVNGEVDNSKLENGALLFYTDPYNDEDWKTPDTETKVYSYELTVVKTGDSNAKLSGAKFTLKKESATGVLEFVKDAASGVYRLAVTTDTDKVTELETDSNGNIKIAGIDVGTYILTETKAPDGYLLPSKPEITITLVDEYKDGKLDSGSSSGAFTNGNATVIPGDENDLNVPLKNSKGFNLPKTGGIGTAIFTIGGILLMGAAVLLIVAVSRKKSAK